MSSQGSNSLINQNNPIELDSDFFNKDVPEFIKNFYGDLTLQEKVQFAETFVSEHLPKLNDAATEKEILLNVTSCLKLLSDNIYKQNKALVASNSESKQIKTLEVLKENIMLEIKVLSIMEQILLIVLDNQCSEMQNVQILILNSSQAILSTFQHCRESNQLYGIYFNDIPEILILFKKNQDLHLKLLQMLENHVQANYSIQEEIFIIQQVLDILENIGEILSGVNVKSFVDNWKSYATFIQKHADILDLKFNMRKPVSFLCGDVLKILKLVFQDLDDTKSITNSLKVGSFNFKVLKKLSETFIEKFQCIQEELWTFFLEIFLYSPAHLRYKNCPENVINLIAAYLFIPIEKFCGHLFRENIIKGLDLTNNLDLDKDCLNFLLLSIIVLENISAGTDQILEMSYRNETFKFIEAVFLAIQIGSNIFFCDIFIKSENIMCSLYDKMVTRMVFAVLTLSKEEYILIEEILLNNILGNNTWSALYASDVWTLLLRHSPSQLCFETTCNFIEQSCNLLKQNISKSQNFFFLKNCIKQSYLILDAESKAMFLKKFCSIDHIHVRICLNLIGSPGENNHVESVILKLSEFVVVLNSGNMSANEFTCMCSTMKCLQSTELLFNGSDRRALAAVIIALWNWFDNAVTVSNGPLLQLYADSLINLTSAVFEKFSETDHLMILELINLQNCDNYLKILVMHILKNIKESREHTFLSCLSHLYSVLFKDPNTIIQHRAFSLYSTYTKCLNTADICGPMKPLNNLAQRYELQVKGSCLQEGEQYLKKLTANIFNHKCVQWTGQMQNFTKINSSELVEHLSKKIKCNGPSVNLKSEQNIKQLVSGEMKCEILNNIPRQECDVSEALGEIKKYVQGMSKVRKENLSPKNLSDIRYIINHLHMLT